MQGDRGSPFAIVGFAVVAFFLSALFLTQHGFDSVRPRQADSGLPLNLEAYLWEDPFAALRRHLERLKKLCAQPALTSVCQSEAPTDTSRFRSRLTNARDLTVIAALLPGSSLGDGEEARRRTRYALLSGLNVAGYAPTYGEGLRLLHVKQCFRFEGCGADAPTANAIVPYETLSARGSKHVLVLWIDDRVLGQRWLSALTGMLKDIIPFERTIRIRILGPDRSEGLATGLKDLVALVAEAHASSDLEAWRQSLNLLSAIQIVSPHATTPYDQLLGFIDSDRERGCLAQSRSTEEAFEHCLAQVYRESIRVPETNDFGRTFFSTIATDASPVASLIAELRTRGLGQNGPQDIVVVAEWDSLYARTFDKLLQRELRNRDATTNLGLRKYYYLRGLDGRVPGDDQAKNTVSEAAGNENSAEFLTGAANKKQKASPIEWPEGTDQRDYLRQIVQKIKEQEQTDGRRIGAIGIVGRDLHDKLLLVQALRSAFPESQLFTTDLDSRLTHPTVNRYTRNLIVASSLPLDLGPDLQCGVSPFRDSYQTAMFLAARYAVASDHGCQDKSSDLRTQINNILASPRLVEIARDGFVGLHLQRTLSSEERSVRFHSALAFFLIVSAVAFLMIVLFPGPAMRKAGQRLVSEGGLPSFDSPKMIANLAGFQVAALGFAIGVVIELALPSGAGLPGVVTMAVGAPIVFWLFVYPGAFWTKRNAPQTLIYGDRVSWAPAAIRIIGTTAAFFFLVAVMIFIRQRLGDTQDAITPFALFSGVSAWPSLMMATLGIVLFAWYLDHVWSTSTFGAQWIRSRYFFDGVAPRPQATTEATQGSSKVARFLRDCLVPRRLLILPDGSLDGTALWSAYESRLQAWKRLARALAGLALILVVLNIVHVLAGDTPASIPARGLSDRQLIFWTLAIYSFLVLLLLMLVSDVMIQSWRFIRLLGRGRTVYPTATVRRFASELGPALKDRAAERVHARYEERGQPGGRNSLLDDWIDVQLIGQHTAIVGRMIIFPFIVLTLLIVSRSQWFDNWHIGTLGLVSFACLIAWSIGVTVLLNTAARTARHRSIERMEKDLLWLQGAGRNYKGLAEQFARLVDHARGSREGSFAPFLDQPSVQALLVPLGGAGAAQILEYLMFAR